MYLGLQSAVLLVLLSFGHSQTNSNGCLRNRDCASDQLCAELECIDPCLLKLCANPAACKVTNHIPVCECQNGFQKPQLGGPGSHECLSNKDCPSDKHCAEFKCVNPCLQNLCANPVDCKVTNHIPVCSSSTSCSEHLPAGSGPDFCQMSEDCQDDQVCSKSKCVNPCLQNVCRNNLSCSVSNHITVCSYNESSSKPTAGESVTKIGKKKFWISNTTKSWNDAVDSCRAKGMRLATIESQEEQNMVEDLIKGHKLNKVWMWIGGADLYWRRVIEWDLTGQPFTNNNFNKGEPDSSENCLGIMQSGDYKWNVFKCEWDTNYICQYYD